MNLDSRVIVALDTADLPTLERWSTELGPVVGGIKVGLQAYAAHGPEAVRTVQRTADAPAVFLDLKLHDIPNTVRHAAAAVADLGIAMLTVHAGGGPDMIAAAVAAAPEVDILAVTVLTSLDDDALAALGQPPVAEQVLRLARMAVDVGASGLVCASTDVAGLRAELGAAPLLVVPGIRPAGAHTGDQTRVGTPGATVAAGADWLVVGRPITTATDPVAAARTINEESR